MIKLTALFLFFLHLSDNLYEIIGYLSQKKLDLDNKGWGWVVIAVYLHVRGFNPVLMFNYGGFMCNVPLYSRMKMVLLFVHQ